MNDQMIKSDVTHTKSNENLLHVIKHVIDQQSFYPLFPPPPDGQVQLDTTHYEALDLPYTPDILLFRSVRPHFAEVVSDVLCINTGPLVRNKTYGVYAHVTIVSEPNTKNPPSPLHQRTRVDVIHL
eukprot:TRINITY_DN15722_c0_g1_i1.p1 TRINITY_DN15722_c0_g1~~TRINITY_DN15722_c0_g1_i1.p1  ORF type:complete len:126 (-),score=14.59 TRINITY_DN15722_c0_g1_i1:48-425(-)